MGLCGAGRYALPSRLRAIIYRIRSPRLRMRDVISGVLRNSGGCRYKACRYCGKTVSTGGAVYILPSGEVYHGKQDCSSLAYYVQKVRRSRGGIYGCVFILWKWIGADGGKNQGGVRGRSDGKQCRDKFHGIYADGFGKCSMFPSVRLFFPFLMVFFLAGSS